jgi:hypothetical protein
MRAGVRPRRSRGVLRVLTLVARKKTGKKPGPKPDPSRVRDAMTMIRSRVPWKEWLERLAEFDARQRRTDTNVSETMDRAAVMYARAIGFEETPPLR